MADAIVCASCGAKIKEGRQSCLRCGEKLVAAEQAPAGRGQFTNRYRGPFSATIALGVSLLVFLLIVTRRPTALVPVAAPQAENQPRAPRVDSVVVEPAVVVPTSFEPKTALDFGRGGAAAYAQGNFARALDYFQQAVEQRPDDAVALTNLGHALVRLGRAREAIPYFIRTIELQPTEWTPQFNLAHAYGELADWVHAIPEYQKAVVLFPDDYVTHYNLAMVFHKSGQEEPAVSEFQRAIQLAPGEPTFRLSLGVSYERLKRPAEAAKAYEEYLALAPEAPEAGKIRARIEALRKPLQG